MDQLLRPWTTSDAVLDVATSDWLSSQEFPLRGYRAEVPISPGPSALDELPSEPTADWLLSQEFPTQPLLCPYQPLTPSSANANAAPGGFVAIPNRFQSGFFMDRTHPGLSGTTEATHGGGL